MKLLTIILLLISSVCFGQVPATLPFSLQDVIDEVNPTTDDLLDCFSDAIPAKFDPIYDNAGYAPANSLLRFRNYGAELPTYEGTGGLAATSDVNSITVTYPSGVVSNDFLILQVWKGYLSNGESYNTPSGWAKVTNTEGNADLSYAMYVKTAGGSEPSSINVTAIDGEESSTPFSGIMYRYSAVSSYSLAGNDGVTLGSGRSVSGITITSGDRNCVFNTISQDKTITTGGNYDLDSHLDNSTLLGTEAIAFSGLSGQSSWSWNFTGLSVYYLTSRITLN